MKWLDVFVNINIQYKISRTGCSYLYLHISEPFLYYDGVLIVIHTRGAG